MKFLTRNNNLRTTLRWILWVFLVQFILLNISAAFYAWKLTHFYEPSREGQAKPSKNVFAKTWRLFSGPRFERSRGIETPTPGFRTERRKLSPGTITSWYLPVDSSKGTIIMFHGLGLDKSTLLDQAYEFRYYGYNVVMVDLRAHGYSGGTTTTLGWKEAEEVRHVYNEIARKGEKNIILYGMSLGAVAIARSIYKYDLKPSRVILDAPFLTLKKHLEARARQIGFPKEPFATLVTAWLSIERGFNGFKHNTADYAEKINCPVLVQYGSLDEWVLPSEVNKVFDHITSANKKLVIYPDAGHEFFLRKDLAKWRKEMEGFLK